MEEMKRCKACNQEIAKGVNKCPHCGKDQRNFFMKHKILSVLIILFVLASIGSAMNNENDTSNINTEEVENSVDTDTNETNTVQVTEEAEPTEVAAPIDDFSDVATEYTLTNGNYIAGIDLPIGRCNLEAVSGAGNVSSSNMYNGGINEMFGIDEGEGLYSESFNGLDMDEDVVFSISGGVTIKITYTNITGDLTGREYDEANAIELSNGNYVAGTDIPSGTYNLEAISGSGNVSSSNIYEGGINEMFGIDDVSGYYSSTFSNLVLSDGVELSISNGVKVKMIPAK